MNGELMQSLSVFLWVEAQPDQRQFELVGNRGIRAPNFDLHAHDNGLRHSPGACVDTRVLPARGLSACRAEKEDTGGHRCTVGRDRAPTLAA